MEQIPRDVIYMAADFFSHLSEDEMVKVNYDYYLEQKPLQTILAEGLKVITDPLVAQKCVYTYLVIYRSYKYYNIQLPEINAETVWKTFEAFIDSREEMKGKSVTPNVYCDEMKVLTQQYNIIHYVFYKFYGADGNPVNYKNEDDGFYAVLFMICQIG